MRQSHSFLFLCMLTSLVGCLNETKSSEGVQTMAATTENASSENQSPPNARSPDSQPIQTNVGGSAAGTRSPGNLPSQTSNTAGTYADSEVQNRMGSGGLIIHESGGDNAAVDDNVIDDETDNVPSSDGMGTRPGTGEPADADETTSAGEPTDAHQLGAAGQPAGAGQPDGANELVGAGQASDAGQPAAATPPVGGGQPNGAGQSTMAGRGDDAGQPAADTPPVGGGQPNGAGQPSSAGQPHHGEQPAPSDNGQIRVRHPEGLPRIHDFSAAPPDHVNRLVRRALDGLGLDDRTGPDPRDRIFVGRWYMAWIDETGFYGKMNGLWSLNGDPNALNFTLLEDDRPVNAFIVGENGDGQWPGGYMGAEHIEFPNSVPEADDDPGCARQGSFCGQYSHGEALRYTDPDIPTWRACNEGSPDWDTHFSPYEVVATPTGLRLMYEGPLTKQGDFGGSTTGNHCHADFLFPDGQRRRVYLRVGYELGAESHGFDRLLQVRNPEGNPEFDGSFSFIGGFVMTTWPNPHPLKRLDRYVRVDEAAVQVRWGDDQVRIEPGRWTGLPGTVPNHDVVLGWARQPVTLSAFADYTEARAFTLSNHGEDSGDSGFCLCIVHGAIEMGGGLISVPVPGGNESHLARRRLTLRHESPAPAPQVWTYEAETDLSHGLGRADADGWSASTNDDEAGHMVFGPYASDWGEGPRSATFRLMVDVADDREERVAIIDIFDADADEIITSRPILRSDFGRSFQYQDFTLDFDMTGRDGHRMETRVYWRDISYLRLDRVIVSE
ncbi:MAG: hypothetical protein VX589_16740 [Myxococcota bacterium]|nr:hypothetical protein [Myxococcota bacterium]